MDKLEIFLTPPQLQDFIARVEQKMKRQVYNGDVHYCSYCSETDVWAPYIDHQPTCEGAMLLKQLKQARPLQEEDLEVLQAALLAHQKHLQDEIVLKPADTIEQTNKISAAMEVVKNLLARLKGGT